jgi:ABC-type transporter Mla MlaB component
MLRIAHDHARDLESTIRLEGKLLTPWVTELARSCNEILRTPGSLQLDLSAVAFVDGAGVALLRDLLGRGVMLPAIRC